MFRLILFFPVIYFSGASLLFYHASAFFLMIRSARLKNDAYTLLLIVTFLFLFLSSTISFLFSGADFDRYLGSLYNASFWLMGLVFFDSARRCSNVDILRISNSAALLFSIFLLFSLLYFYFDSPVSFPSVVGFFVDVELQPQIIRDSVVLELFNIDYISNKDGIRLSALAPYPTATAMSAFVIFYLATLSNRSFWLEFFLILSLFFIIYTTGSRLVFGMAITYFIIIMAFSIYYFNRVFFVFLLVLFIIFSLFFLVDFFYYVVSLRSGSSSDRFSLYNHSLMMAMDSPFLGVGIKPRIAPFQIPLGSHSAWLGLFFRSGIFGFFSVMFFFMIISYNAFLSALKGARSSVRFFAFVFSIVFYMIFEDIDSAQFLCFIIFLSLGLSLSRLKKHQEFFSE